jgi:hypothetical protein
MLPFFHQKAKPYQKVTNKKETDPKTETKVLTLEEAAQYLTLGKSILYDLAYKRE